MVHGPSVLEIAVVASYVLIRLVVIVSTVVDFDVDAPKFFLVVCIFVSGGFLVVLFVLMCDNSFDELFDIDKDVLLLKKTFLVVSSVAIAVVSVDVIVLLNDVSTD